MFDACKLHSTFASPGIFFGGRTVTEEAGADLAGGVSSGSESLDKI